MMRRGIVLAAVFVALALGGCSKNDVRLFKLYTFQIEDDAKKRPRKQTATAPAIVHGHSDVSTRFTSPLYGIGLHNGTDSL